MTWKSRLKLVVGILLVLVIVAAATLVFNQRITRATSHSAEITAEAYPVGADYAGTISRRYVDNGDAVEQGQPLFEIESLQLSADLASGIIEAGGTIGADGVLTVTSPVDGTVSGIELNQGGFAQAGTVIGVVNRAGSLYASAEFTLIPRDFARIETGSAAQIRLPNQATLQGSVTHIDVTAEGTDAVTTITVESKDLIDGQQSGLVSPGTPVSVTVSLRDDGPLAGVNDMLRDLAIRIGLL
jgi:multidrug resistance efflux pump